MRNDSKYPSHPNRPFNFNQAQSASAAAELDLALAESGAVDTDDHLLREGRKQRWYTSSNTAGSFSGVTPSTPSGSGTAAIINGRLYTTFTTAAALNAANGIYTNQFICRGAAPFGAVSFKTGPSIAVQRLFIGFFGTAPTTDTVLIGSVANTNRQAALVYDPAVSANWILQTCDGTTKTGADTGLAVVADTEYLITLDMTDTTKCVAKVNGTLAGTATATLPPTNPTPGSVGLTARCTTLEAVAKTIHVSFLECEFSV